MPWQNRIPEVRFARPHDALSNPGFLGQLFKHMIQRGNNRQACLFAVEDSKFEN